jgi:hypothetical protein
MRRTGKRRSASARSEFRDQDSAVGEEVRSGCVEATRERGRLFPADFGSATVSFPLSAVRDFEAERDLRLRVGVAATSSLVTSADFDATRDRLLTGFASTSTGVGAAGGDTSGVASPVRFRPNPNDLAIVERRSE